MRFTLYILLLGIPVLNWAQDSLSIEDAIVLGLQNNYQIQISKLEEDIAANNNSWGKAGAFPTINLNVQGKGTSSEYLGSSIPGAPTTAEVSEAQSFIVGGEVALSWVVFNGFRVRTTRAQLADIQEQSEGNAAIIVENTLQGILLAYNLALLQQESLDVLKEVLKLSRDRYQYILDKKQFGSAVTFDVLQAESSYLTDSANVLKQQINLQNSIRNLNLVLAAPVENVYFLSSNFTMVDQEFILADLLAKLESNNKTLKNQYIYQEILKKNVKLNQSQLYPFINFSAGINQGMEGNYYDYSDGSWGDRYSYNAMLVLSWTLSDGGNVKRAIKNAKLNEQIGELQIDQMKQTLYNQIFSTYSEYNVRKQLKNVSIKGEESAKLNLQIADEKYRSGAITSFNFRDIQIVYLNAAREMLQANFDLVQTYTELLRLTGGIITEYSN